MFANDIKKELKARGLWDRKIDHTWQPMITVAIGAVIKKYEALPDFKDIVTAIKLDSDARVTNIEMKPVFANELATLINKKDRS